ncbi:unnamed protein product [Spodoptera exigua]|nr:unnamed protein product [Spodoptera exigua]
MVGTRRARNNANSMVIPRQNSVSDNGRARQNLSPEALAAMNKEQLRAECRKRGQRATGNKNELISDSEQQFVEHTKSVLKSNIQLLSWVSAQISGLANSSDFKRSHLSRRLSSSPSVARDHITPDPPDCAEMVGQT